MKRQLRRLATLGRGSAGSRRSAGWPARERFLEEAVAHAVGFASVEIDGVTYLTSTADAGVDRDVFVRGRRPELIVLPRAVTALGGSFDGTVFVDVGASIGTSTLPALLHHGFGSAVSCEPGKESAALLRANAALNGVSDRVAVVEAAVSDREGELLLNLATSSGGTRRVLAPSERADLSAPIRAVTIDALVEQGVVEPERVGLLWVDAQGHEPQVLDGAASLLGRGIPAVVAIRPSKLSAAGTSDRLVSVVKSRYERLADLRAPGLREPDWRPDWRPVGDVDEFLGRSKTTDLLLVRDAR